MLQTIDYVILVVIGLSVLTGIFRGFVKELIALCVWVLAIWLGMTYSHDLSPFLTRYIDDSSVRTAVGFVAILLTTLILGALVNGILSFILHKTGLSGTDRLLGMVFGGVRGVFIVALIILILNMTSLAKTEDYAHRSVLYSLFDPLVHWLSSFTPELIKHAKLFEQNNQIQAATVGTAFH